MAEEEPDRDRPSSEPLELREARYRTLFESSNSVLWAADPAGRFAYGQREWQRFTGLDLDEQIDFGWLDAIHEDDRGHFVQDWARARASTDVFVSEVRIWSEVYDEYRECELRSAPLFDDEGRVREWVGHLIDVSELRRAQAAVHQRDVMLSALVENAPIPIFVKDRHGYYVLASKHVTEMLTGKLGESIIGRKDDELLPWRVAQRIRENDEEVLSSGEIRIFEEMVPQSGGEDRWWLTTKFPLPAPNGETGRSIAGIAVDVTERRKLADERAEAIRRRDGFLAMLSHELRNPMQAIQHAVRMVDADQADTRHEATAIIRRQAQHVSKMLADLLDVSRMVHGRIDLAEEPVSIERVVDAAVETVGPLASTAGIELRVHNAGGHVLGDETRLVQVVVNLLRNAVSHSQQDDPIELRVLTRERTLVIEVSDSGVGIEPDELERIFDPFYQRQQSIARSAGGLGLGLSLGRTLATLHGGTLEAESPGMGQGARFTLTLPLLKGAETRAPSSKPAPKDGGDALTFVIVEDNDDSREMLVLWLRSRGHTVIPCADGETGLEAILDQEPDVAVVDIGLPGLDGYGVARGVRERWKGTAPVRLVAVTGYGRDEDRKQVIEAGFDAHLVKPVEVEVLEQVLTEEGQR